MEYMPRNPCAFTIDLGIRFDQVIFDISGTELEEYNYSTGTYIAGQGDYNIYKTYDSFSPRLGLTYKLTDVVNIFGNYSTGIQTPTEGEVSENPDLNLVKVKNYELGLKARHKKWKFDTSIYYSPVENEVTRVIQPGGESEYLNAGETDKRGFEFAGSYNLTSTLNLGATYSYTDYVFEEFTETVKVGGATVNIDRSGNRLPYIPKHQYSFLAHYRHPSGLKFKVKSHTWDSYYMDNANTEKYKGYSFLTNAMIGYEKDGFDIGLNVDNMFDKRYAVEVEKDTGGEKEYTPATPRSFIIRLTYNF